MFTRTISVDSGKYGTKASMATAPGTFQHLSFRTQMTEGAEKMSSLNNNTYAVEFEGRTYLLGDQARGQSFERSKQSDLHKIATYTAVALMMKTSGSRNDNVVLAIGCPLSIYLNKDARKNYRDFIAQPGKQVRIKVDEVDYQFTVLQSYVYPEGSGVITLNSQTYSNDIVGVIDIGGLNANCCIYDCLVPKTGTDSMFTLEMGGNILVSNIMTTLETEFNTEIPDLLYDKIMRDGYIKKDPEKSRGRIAELKDDHIRKIFNECKRHKWATDNMDIVFTGGTAKVLKDEIQKVFPTAIVDYLDEEASFKNADGFLTQTLLVTGQVVYIS